MIFNDSSNLETTWLKMTAEKHHISLNLEKYD